MRTPLRRSENPRPRHIPMIILYARRGIIKKARSPQRAPRFSDFSPRRAALERDGLSLCFSEIENHQEDSGNRGDARENVVMYRDYRDEAEDDALPLPQIPVEPAFEGSRKRDDSKHGGYYEDGELDGLNVLKQKHRIIDEAVDVTRTASRKDISTFNFIMAHDGFLVDEDTDVVSFPNKKEEAACRSLSPELADPFQDVIRNH